MRVRLAFTGMPVLCSIALASGLVSCLALGPALGRDKNDVTVAMKPGQPCWAYHGNGTGFIATFAAHQRITVHMRGEMTEVDPKTNRVITSIDDREPDVLGPDNFLRSGEAGKLEFETPTAGEYSFSFSPNAMQGNPGDVEICAR